MTNNFLLRKIMAKEKRKRFAGMTSDDVVPDFL
nr:MAG TPA: hypothetical protein [Caudoviricetes sp.]